MSHKLISIGLIETTTDSQMNNGTREFMDPNTNALYSSYSSGYIRRKPIRSGSYQLNKKISIEQSPNGIRYQRIMEFNPDNRIDIIAHAVVNYRAFLNR